MVRLKRFLLTFIPLAGMLIGLPLLGVWLAGLPLEPYFEFPPQTRFVQHAPFSWTAFCLYSALIAAAIFTVALRAMRAYRRSPPVAASGAHPFPGWGWVADRRRGCGLGPGVDPFSLDGGFSAPHLHPALVGLHRRGQRAVLPADGALAADPSPALFLVCFRPARCSGGFSSTSTASCRTGTMSGNASARGSISGTPPCRLPRSCRRS